MQFISPTAAISNRLLWGDWSKGEYGLLVRGLDYFDTAKYMNYLLYEKYPNETLHYLPASFVHASLRPSNAMFPSDGQPSCGVLVGTKFKLNWSIKQQFQNDDDEDDGVSTPTFYPIDCSSSGRRNKDKINILFTPEGYGCHEAQGYICINRTSCLTNRKIQCACDYETVPGRLYGEYTAQWINRTGRTFRVATTCWYPNTTRGIQEMRAATNSLWKERHRWSPAPSDLRYRGWTECPVTKNIRDKNTLDAIIIKLPAISSDPHLSLEHFKKHQLRRLQFQLGRMFRLGYATLPVVIMRESKGMRNQTECDRFWEGKDCDDGYRKDIFSQTFNFSDGSCLYKHDVCDEVYYYPVNNTTGLCSINLNVSCPSFCGDKMRIKTELDAILWEGTVLMNRSYIFVQYGSFLVLLIFVVSVKKFFKRK